ncbi:class F sortase [Egicoccus sp. AB-alg6-2]|uniref:class F sortase n=1 Tax=Egicoccus sp. AB-alg6-2 TaxID=3242692 RepID=UPI00359F07B2
MFRFPRRLAASLPAALLLTACGTGEPGTAAPDGALAGDTVATGDAHDHHTMEEHEAFLDGLSGSDADAVEVAGSVTERTIAQLRAMDPQRLASLHDHGGHDAHTDHAGHADDTDPERAATHPNGIDPVRVVIPAIGVDADVVELGLEANGEMEVPTDFAQTGWFRHGPRPGRVGPAVIAGHVDDRNGPAVFHRLRELTAGDEIQVHGEQGEIVTFTVRELERHPKDDFPTERVYAGTPGPELRLITCGGDFDRDARSYRDNVIVYAERTDV